MNPSLKVLRTWTKLLIRRSVWNSYSQSGEDAVVRALLGGIEKGVYVDVGAYDPVLYSNTYNFYKMGWRGLVIDPNKSLATLFRILRPRDTFIHTAVGQPSDLMYYKFKDGAYNTLDPTQVAILANTKSLSPEAQYRVGVRPLSDIVIKAGLTRIDFLSVDVEGMDEEVLNSHDWSIRPKVVCAEDTTFNASRPTESTICRSMLNRGYRIAGFAGVSLLFADESRS